MIKIAITGMNRAAALAAVAHLPQVMVYIDAAKEAEAQAIRSVLLTGAGHGMEVGQTVQCGGETYRVSAPWPTMRGVMLEQMVREPLSIEPPSKPAFGSDRPYLKKKKGRS
ncbi:hypothetical protein GTP38_11035 [Duganella sp. FT94W]|uniref:Uncharacterized protein n=1 Tax=Duganella lactea TaxID=2692173 RepID=A0ABW9V5L2_9BURK|nr:hypothetical protein [Duganella lactea]MYM34873.1 hypothetical protein [Duganella lactea]